MTFVKMQSLAQSSVVEDYVQAESVCANKFRLCVSS